MLSIVDGTGDSHGAEVDKNYKLHTYSVSVNEAVSATINGESFILSTGIKGITNDTDNYLHYVRNTSGKDLVISETIFSLGESTGGASNEVTFLGQINPTGGTIISSGFAYSPFNTNLGSPEEFDGTAQLATSLGLTATGGTQADGFIPNVGRTVFNTPFILPKGASLAGGVKCSTGNTSQTVSIGYVAYFRDKEIF